MRIIVITIVLMMIANVASAAFRPYIVGRVAYVDINNQADQWSTDTSVRSTIVDKRLSDQNFGYRLAGGAEIPFCDGIAKSIRTEVEYGLLNKTHNTGVWGLNMPLGTTFNSNYMLETKIQTVFANIYYDLDTGTAITPYIGVGIGWAHINEIANVSTPAISYSAHSKTTEDNFAWNIGAGVSYEMTEKLAVEIGYRYTEYGKIKDKSLNNYAKRDYDSHEGLLGLRYDF